MKARRGSLVWDIPPYSKSRYVVRSEVKAPKTGAKALKIEARALKTPGVQLSLLPLVEWPSPLSYRSVNPVNCPSLVGPYRIRPEVAEERLSGSNYSPPCLCQQPLLGW